MPSPIINRVYDVQATARRLIVLYGLGRFAVGRFIIVKESGRMPRSTSCQVMGAAIGKPGRARGDQVPMAVVPRPLRR